MEQKERTLKPEILKDEALRVVSSLKFENFEEFSFHGTDFLIVLHTREDIENSVDNKEEVFFTASTAIAGYDIYVLDSLPLKEKRRRVFHEIIEAKLRTQNYSGPAAHDLAAEAVAEVFDEKKNGW